MPRSSSAPAPANAVDVRRSIVHDSLSSIFLADQHRSASTTSNIRVRFRQCIYFGRDAQPLWGVDIEERPQVGIPKRDVRDVERANPHVRKEANDLFFPLRNLLFDERQATLAIDRVKCLEHQA